ncbi:WhiB family transcriptional regulator [Kribbella sp. CA-294648]|uniref:WhiB family transcriptional regulator n=1 Tax=Kribbella sp. CA-294648 TaxID=3239948 RepID=UPI003D8AF6C5
MDWRHQGACLDVDADLFFPIGSSNAAYHQMEDARKVCMRCPVREQCLAWALESGHEQGIWGGTTDDERRLLRRRMSRHARSA